MRWKSSILFSGCGLLFICLFADSLRAQADLPAVIAVKKTNDFTINGAGSNKNWQQTSWVDLPLRDTSDKTALWATKMKILYSDSGLYVLFSCQDSILTATIASDFKKLWEEDVVEIFLWPETDSPSYFEYELSPLNFELPLLVTNINGDLTRWRPYLYKGDHSRQTMHKTTAFGGPKQSNAVIKKWKAEIFIPFKLLRPLIEAPPEPGSRWKANFYRVDYDGKMPGKYEWQPVNKTFHEIDKFGFIVFE